MSWYCRSASRAPGVGCLLIRGEPLSGFILLSNQERTPEIGVLCALLKGPGESEIRIRHRFSGAQVFCFCLRLSAFDFDI
jgi:hypothetical protein